MKNTTNYFFLSNFNKGKSKLWSKIEVLKVKIKTSYFISEVMNIKINITNNKGTKINQFTNCITNFDSLFLYGVFICI